LAVAAAPDDPFCIERGSVQGFPLAKISESRFLFKQEAFQYNPARDSDPAGLERLRDGVDVA
jgi:hypothetical protein